MTHTVLLAEMGSEAFQCPQARLISVKLMVSLRKVASERVVFKNVRKIPRLMAASWMSLSHPMLFFP